ncbi:uncharacterized protein LOC114804714 [Zeugodacus cucurbitae]|uniref:uncharacterized protein LOC114804714 n=1 Tax=Zeugodacus cucurbitae TaxID=28588 RepID=UPI0010A74866|nr:uncharacterized protein LOC114804714 [Zeugodacus cucurbitae]XP_054082805.1 uncharacterized protein LOC114804714 [Zeugodacus cucurbitae]
MDRNSMHIQTVNRHVTHNTNHQQPVTVYTNADRSSEIQYCYERPMMLNTWTQTSNADLGISDDYMQNMYIEEQKQREKILLERIRDLESKVRVQSEIISQQSSSGRGRNSYSQKIRNSREIIVNPIPVQMHENQSHHMQRQQQDQYTATQFQVYNTEVSSRNVHCEEQQSPQQRSEPTHHFQNSMQTQYMPQNVNVAIQHQDVHTVTNTIQSVRPRKVNYTIIADGNVNGHDGPIEIEIAEEENGLNLNGSADSERLEICLAEEAQQTTANDNDIKFEHNGEQRLSTQLQQQNTITPGTSSKRFKMSTENISQYADQNKCESPESTQTVSHYSNTRAVTETSPTVPQYPDSQNCEITEQQQVITANDNHSNVPANGGEIKHDGQEERAMRKSDLKQNSYTSIGPNNTRVPIKVFDNVNWDNPSMATRKLMMAVFDRETLATHSMTGKPSPAFKDHNKPLKKMLNPLVIQDIIFAVTRRCRVSDKEVRNAITTKCADENKMWKLAQAKFKPFTEQNKENVA